MSKDEELKDALRTALDTTTGAAGFDNALDRVVELIRIIANDVVCDELQERRARASGDR